MMHVKTLNKWMTLILHHLYLKNTTECYTLSIVVNVSGVCLENQ